MSRRRTITAFVAPVYTVDEISRPQSTLGDALPTMRECRRLVKTREGRDTLSTVLRAETKAVLALLREARGLAERDMTNDAKRLIADRNVMRRHNMVLRRFALLDVHPQA